MFGSLAEPGPAAEWAARLAEHHRKTQRLKPPDGKNPWFERYDDGSYIIRPLYRRDEGGRHNDDYVHAYRTGSLWSFVRDLKLVGP
jgi:fatty-acid desaturase